MDLVNLKSFRLECVLDQGQAVFQTLPVKELIYPMFRLVPEEHLSARNTII